MKMKLLPFILIPTLLAGAANAQSYISVAGGSSGKTDYGYNISTSQKLKVELDSGAAYSIAYGVKNGNNRFELAISGHKHDDGKFKVNGVEYSDPVEASSYSLDLNAFMDIPTKSFASPYLGIGAGVTQLELNDGILNDSTETLHLMGAAGVSFKLEPKLSLFLEARADRYGTVTIEADAGAGTVEQDFSMSNVSFMGGFRYNF